MPVGSTCAFALLCTAVARAAPAPPPANDAALCRAAIAAAEAQTRIPDQFLSAIGRVESGRPFAGNRLAPWPWTINAAGTGHFYPTKPEAVAAARAFQAAGVQSIDVGCLQVSLMYHKDAFASLDEAFDPVHNADYAARFLLGLFAQTGSWPRAAAAYHSQTPALGEDYQRKVLAQWAEPEAPTTAVDAGKRAGPVALTAALPQPGAEAPAPGGLGGPVLGFTRSLRVQGSASPLQTGRPLTSYRAFPVHISFHAPPPAVAPH